jgi:hypothetical protein
MRGVSGSPSTISLFLMRLVIWRVTDGVIGFQVARWRPAILVTPKLPGAFSRQHSFGSLQTAFQSRGLRFNSQVVEWEDAKGIEIVNRSRGSNVVLVAGWQLPTGWHLR